MIHQHSDRVSNSELSFIFSSLFTSEIVQLSVYLLHFINRQGCGIWKE